MGCVENCESHANSNYAIHQKSSLSIHRSPPPPRLVTRLGCCGPWQLRHPRRNNAAYCFPFMAFIFWMAEFLLTTIAAIKSTKIKITPLLFLTSRDYFPAFFTNH